MARKRGTTSLFQCAVAATLAMMLGSTLCVGAAEPKGNPPEVQDPDDYVQGIPWTGEPGITETVADIMVRARAYDAFIGPHFKEQIEPGEADREHLEQNTDSLEVRQWPPERREAEGTQRLPMNPQPIGVSFLGPQISEAPWIPPDSMGAVGPTQVLVIANGRIKVYDRLGNLGALNADTDVFFNSVRNGSGTSDPHIR